MNARDAINAIMLLAAGLAVLWLSDGVWWSSFGYWLCAWGGVTAAHASGEWRARRRALGAPSPGAPARPAARPDPTTEAP